ncbi:hypothetical protein [Streptomyces cinnamoneus]|uniref:Uncharacterized protein n=1 Tax=Streptomyces cinnamoneus TaxID=53446 RepID=A0A918WEY2_STRCJ|nr:hypothetical protein [Streptomyces cinnamoneus]GHC39058.1 hypothetical protein GCM10010507_10930 [Streptomyces cinnamoneus]
MALRTNAKAGVVGFVVAAVAATAFAGHAQAASDVPPAGAGHRATQRAMDAAVRAGIPGVTAQARDTGGVWRSASGVGNLTSGAPRGKNDTGSTTSPSGTGRRAGPTATSSPPRAT